MRTAERELSVPVRIYREGDGYVAHSPYVDIASQGDTIEEARENFAEAFTLWLETASEGEIASRLPAAELDSDRVFETHVRVPYHAQAQGTVRR